MHKDSFAKVETEDESVVWSEFIFSYLETTLIGSKYLSLAAVYSVLNDCLAVIPTTSILEVLNQVCGFIPRYTYTSVRCQSYRENLQ